MDFSKMLKQAQEMQQKMMEAKDGLKNVIAEGVAGGGSVKVQMNGHFELVKVDISDEILKEEKGVLEDLIIAATNNAKKAVDAVLDAPKRLKREWQKSGATGVITRFPIATVALFLMRDRQDHP